MTPDDYAAACQAVAGRPLGPLGSALGAGMAEYLPPHGVTTPLRLAHFLAQTAHETGGYRWLTELASGTAYEGRKDLGNTEPGDGSRFKGRGLLQITGRANYARYGAAVGVDLVDHPELAAAPQTAVATAAVYWDGHSLNALADADDILGITRRINGGLRGLPDRKAMLAKAKAHLGVKP